MVCYISVGSEEETATEMVKRRAEVATEVEITDEGIFLYVRTEVCSCMHKAHSFTVTGLLAYYIDKVSLCRYEVVLCKINRQWK